MRLFPSLDRFNAFSDGVFAIAITLLVLELPVPPSDVAIWPALQEASHDFLGYLISFAFIGGIWLTHARLTKVMRRGDMVSYGLNLLLLLFVPLLPFSTSLMVTHLDAPDIGAGVVLYGLNVLLASLTRSCSPIRNMPPVVQAVTYLIPGRYFLAALRAIILKGAGWSAIWDQILYLTAFTVVSLAASAAKLGRSERERPARLPRPRRGRAGA